MGAKEKLLKYLDFKKISQGKFCRSIGVSNGFLSSGVHIGSDKLKVIRDNYDDLNMDWLIYDEGEMLLFDKKSVVSESVEKYDSDTGCKNCDHLEDLIEAKNETIAILKHQLGIDNGSSKAS